MTNDGPDGWIELPMAEGGPRKFAKPMHGTYGERGTVVYEHELPANVREHFRRAGADKREIPERVVQPCPFCGGEAKLLARDLHDTTPEPRRKLYWYLCNTHGCGVGFTHGEWSEAAALKKWNSRKS